MKKQPKFLVDLKNRVFVSEKPHQDIIDENGLDPAGYDNYFKGWVYDKDAKVWVEQVNDLVFRYWDQAKVGFKRLVEEGLLSPSSRTIAVVDRREEKAGTVADFLGVSQSAFANARLGEPVLLNEAVLKAGTRFRMNATVRVARDRYIARGTQGRLLRDVRVKRKVAPILPMRWEHSESGSHKRKAALTHPTDSRVILPI